MYLPWISLEFLHFISACHYPVYCRLVFNISLLTLKYLKEMVPKHCPSGLALEVRESRANLSFNKLQHCGLSWFINPDWVPIKDWCSLQQVWIRGGCATWMRGDALCVGCWFIVVCVCVMAGDLSAGWKCLLPTCREWELGTTDTHHNSGEEKNNNLQLHKDRFQNSLTYEFTFPFYRISIIHFCLIIYFYLSTVSANKYVGQCLFVFGQDLLGCSILQ